MAPCKGNEAAAFLNIPTCMDSTAREIVALKKLQHGKRRRFSLCRCQCGIDNAGREFDVNGY
jgi:hypothetical protein